LVFENNVTVSRSKWSECWWMQRWRVFFYLSAFHSALGRSRRKRPFSWLIGETLSYIEETASLSAPNTTCMQRKSLVSFYQTHLRQRPTRFKLSKETYRFSS